MRSNELSLAVRLHQLIEFVLRYARVNVSLPSLVGDMEVLAVVAYVRYGIARYGDHANHLPPCALTAISTKPVAIAPTKSRMTAFMRLVAVSTNRSTRSRRTVIAGLPFPSYMSLSCFLMRVSAHSCHSLE